MGHGKGRWEGWSKWVDQIGTIHSHKGLSAPPLKETCFPLFISPLLNMHVFFPRYIVKWVPQGTKPKDPLLMYIAFCTGGVEVSRHSLSDYGGPELLGIRPHIL